MRKYLTIDHLIAVLLFVLNLLGGVINIYFSLTRSWWSFLTVPVSMYGVYLSIKLFRSANYTYKLKQEINEYLSKRRFTS